MMTCPSCCSSWFEVLRPEEKAACKPDVADKGRAARTSSAKDGVELVCALAPESLLISMAVRHSGHVGVCPWHSHLRTHSACQTEGQMSVAHGRAVSSSPGLKGCRQMPQLSHVPLEAATVAFSTAAGSSPDCSAILSLESTAGSTETSASPSVHVVPIPITSSCVRRGVLSSTGTRTVS